MKGRGRENVGKPIYKHKELEECHKNILEEIDQEITSTEHPEENDKTLAVHFSALQYIFVTVFLSEEL